jgi:hypothetical protein
VCKQLESINAAPVTASMLAYAMNCIDDLSVEDKISFTARVRAIIPVVEGLGVDGGDNVVVLLAIDYRLQALAALITGGIVSRFGSLDIDKAELHAGLLEAAASLPLKNTPPQMSFDPVEVEARVRLISETAGRA